MSVVHPSKPKDKKQQAHPNGSLKESQVMETSLEGGVEPSPKIMETRRYKKASLTGQMSLQMTPGSAGLTGGSPGMNRRKILSSKFNEKDASSCTTVAVGEDTYTIVASRKSSTKKTPLFGETGSKMNTSKDDEVPSSGEEAETIRIFRRSRSHRPSSATRSESVLDHHSINLDASSTSAVALTSIPNVSSLVSSISSSSATAFASLSQPFSSQYGVTSDDDFSLHKTEEVPAPDSMAGTREAFIKLKQLLTTLRGDTIDKDTLVSNLEYVSEVVQAVIAKTEDEAEDDLSELQSEAVPDEVRKWLASTFAKQESAPKRRAGTERPSFKSVANAIRTGIFIERIYRRMSSSQFMVVPQEVQNKLQLSNEWTFDTFSFAISCKGSPLRFMGYELLTKHGCLHKYKIPPSTLETMLVQVEHGYAQNGNPYHNNMHACDVLQTVHYFISQTGLENWLSDLEIFTCLIAAIIHDYDHSGTTNNFHVNSGSDLAVLYNDRAVLENHHVSAFFRTIKEHDCNIFANMQKSDFRDFRALIIDMVLHTDMTQHFSQLKAMKTAVQQHSGEPSFDKTKVLCLLLHSCDVSHPAKRWDVHYQWTSRCLEEFFRQGDREAEMGLEYSPLCDRHNTMVPQSQIGFIDFIVSPTLNVLGDVMEIILKSLESQNNNANNKSKSLNVSEDLPSSGSNSAVATSKKNDPLDSKSISHPPISILKRPWIEILGVNRSQWQCKHDEGEQGIAPSGAEHDLRPSSVNSITGNTNKSRPNSATSTGSTLSSANRMETLTEKAEARKEEESFSKQAFPSGDPRSSIERPTTATSLNSVSQITVTSCTTGIYEGLSSTTEVRNPGQFCLDSEIPAKETKINDIMDDISPQVLSRPGSPNTWEFSEKEKDSLKSTPPRATSASLCSPPVPRKVPISVDHHLRK